MFQYYCTTVYFMWMEYFSIDKILKMRDVNGKYDSAKILILGVLFITHSHTSLVRLN